MTTRICQHEKSIEDKKWDSSGVSNHGKTCKERFLWNETKPLRLENRRFDRKVREVLEIQFRETSPHSEQGLSLDGGQYVTMKFWKLMISYLRKKSLIEMTSHISLRQWNGFIWFLILSYFCIYSSEEVLHDHQMKYYLKINKLYMNDPWKDSFNVYVRYYFNSVRHKAFSNGQCPMSGPYFDPY